ncbi:hypothetical protein [Rhodococcus koreensis]|uniref:hypothetical protein n=1 Tax=Rhodococcus koreensis TaxID=99653 RepID=UPI0036DE4321
MLVVQVDNVLDPIGGVTDALAVLAVQPGVAPPPAQRGAVSAPADVSYLVATLRGMGESAVSNAAITDAAELLTQKADMLLERLTDRVMATPTPGSRAWYAHRSTAADSAKERLLVRIAIAHQAHFDLAEDIARARAAGAGWVEIGEVTGLSAHRARKRWDTTPAPSRRQETDQLTIW